METLSPRTSPQQVKDDRVRARKLRMSCDACSNSKVKCDQTRPVCSRCQKTGLQCKYSPSQRKGKPPACSRDLCDAINGRKRARSSTSPRPPCPEMHASSLEENDAAPQTTLQLNHDLPTEHDWPMLDFDQDDSSTAFWQKFAPDMGDLSTSDMSMTPWNLFQHDFLPPAGDTPSIEHSAQIGATDDNSSLEEDSPGLPDAEPRHTLNQPQRSIAPPSLPTPASSDTDTSFQRPDCRKLASFTVHELDQDCQPSCIASSSTPNPSSSIVSFDRVLDGNKIAIENAHQLLSCPCFLSQQSALTLCIIVDKILSRYQAIISASATATRQSPTSSDLSSRSHAQATPNGIGAYKTDAKDEPRRRMQVVSTELRKAAALVDRYADRYCGRRDTAVYPTLAGLLRKRLRDTMAEMVLALQISSV
ncbi:MAG: hypothetical protein LQ338_003280 [Usnochroma carphineum]|nr:MAG: hypothetical protein LQ338_003280 [Usnochroma carphineum]